MKIVRHKLESDTSQIEWRQTPNVSSGTLDPKYLVMHYTAGRSYSSSVDWLSNRDAKASAHIVIGRGGEVAQLARFDQIAWHAGQSRWRGITGLNSHSIGIELDNAGPLTPDFTGDDVSYSAWFKKRYPESEVFYGEHKSGSEYEYWHDYTEIQLATAIKVASAIVLKYGIIDVIGHDDIAPGRKLDPGPAFPMDSFRSSVMGREPEDLPTGTVMTSLNIRTGPGTAYDKLPGSPLPAGTLLLIRAREASWLAVDVLKDGLPDLSGWVHGDYVSEA